MIPDILRSFSLTKIIVTGGTGLIGRFVVKKLCDFSAYVTVVSLDKLNIDKRAEHILGDLTDFNFVKKLQVIKTLPSICLVLKDL